MNRAEIIKFLLNKSNMNISELTKEMGVHRTNVYHWRDGITTPKKSTINKLSEILNISIKWEGKDQVDIVDTPIQLKEEKIDMNMNSIEILELQKYKITSLEKENQKLKDKVKQHKSTPVQETVWNQLEFDFQCEVKLTFKNFKMGRSILSITNSELQSKVLGYSANELKKLWDIGTYYKNSEKHPVDAMLHKNTLKGIQERIKSLPQIFEQLKNMMGNHYIPQPLTYVCKDKSLIGAIAYNKVNWKDKTVDSKVKFIIEE